VRTRVWMMAALVAACGTAPPRQMPDFRVEIADAWSRADSAAAVQGGNWWERLGDTELSSIVDRALSHNLDLKAAGARLRAAQGQAKIAGAPLWPQVSAGGTGAERKQIFVGLPIPGGPASSTSTSYGVSLDVSWELDLWGRLSAGRAAGVADHQIGRAHV
jgi:outer membrane protein TolC